MSMQDSKLIIAIAGSSLAATVSLFIFMGGLVFTHISEPSHSAAGVEIEHIQDDISEIKTVVKVNQQLIKELRDPLISSTSISP